MIKTGANTKLFSMLTVILPKPVAAPADPFTIANSSSLSSCTIDFLLIPSLFLWMYLDFVRVSGLLSLAGERFWLGTLKTFTSAVETYGLQHW